LAGNQIDKRNEIWKGSAVEVPMGLRKGLTLRDVCGSQTMTVGNVSRNRLAGIAAMRWADPKIIPKKRISAGQLT
jgi:hypothetical protein